MDDQRAYSRFPWSTPLTDNLQHFGLLESNVRIQDPMWPAVREVARRILREDSLVIQAGESYMQELDSLILAMGDAQPARLAFPTIQLTQSSMIEITQQHPTSLQPLHLARLGTEEPEPEVCWIPLATNEAWNCVLEACHELLAAGYPGCVGCGGPNSEEEWDEAKSRENWNAA